MCGWMGQLFMTLGYQKAAASPVSMVKYSELVFALIIQSYALGAPPGAVKILGCSLALSTVVLLFLKQASVRVAAARSTATASAGPAAGDAVCGCGPEPLAAVVLSGHPAAASGGGGGRVGGAAGGTAADLPSEIRDSTGSLEDPGAAQVKPGAGPAEAAAGGAGRWGHSRARLGQQLQAVASAAADAGLRVGCWAGLGGLRASAPGHRPAIPRPGDPHRPWQRL